MKSKFRFSVLWASVRTPALWVVLLAPQLVLASNTAWAHSADGHTGGLLDGLLHPISGLDHVLAMVAVGLWGAQLGAPAIWLLPITFPVVMAFGGLLGLLGVALPGTEIGIALSALVLGAMVFAEARPPLWLSMTIVGVFAVFHGHAHGSELPEDAAPLLYSLGFVTATGLLHAAGISVGLIHRWPVGRMALRGAGAAIACAGPVFLWMSLA